MAARRKQGVVTASAARRGRRRPAFVVGPGGSAGGLEAFEQFFAATPVDTGLAFVVVTHLDPDHKALLPELVQRVRDLPQAKDVYLNERAAARLRAAGVAASGGGA